MKNYLLKAARLLALLLVLMQTPFVYAQSSTDLTGTVLNEKGNPLQGVTVVLQQKGANNQKVMTNEKGNYTLKQLAIGSKYNVKFSYVGYTEIEQTITFAKSGNNIVTRMNSLSSELNEVVVTALGIKKQEKALGYAAQTMKECDVLDARSNNWVSSLSGKVAGLNLYSAGSGPGGSVRVSLRGDASMNPDGNNALIVLDGVPMNGGGTSSGVGNAYGAGSGSDVPVDFGKNDLFQTQSSLFIDHPAVGSGGAHGAYFPGCPSRPN